MNDWQKMHELDSRLRHQELLENSRLFGVVIGVLLVGVWVVLVKTGLAAYFGLIATQ